MSPRRRLAALSAAFVCAALQSCAAFPHKQPPVQLARQAPLEGIELAAGGAWPPAEWWKRYRDATLDELIARGIEHAPSLETAHARYESAQQSVRLAAAAAGAHVDANADIDRQRLSENGLFPPRLLGFTWYNQADLGLSINYIFDWWGKQRLAVDSAVNLARAAEADRSAARLVLASSIADTYFGWQADQNRLRLAHERLDTLGEEHAIAVARVNADLEAADAVHRSDLALANARGEIAMLQGSAKLRMVELAALVGGSVADLPPLSMHPLPAAMGTLPDSVKIDLIARRADIAASRWRVEAAEKNLAAARAEFFPDVSINALLGVSSVDVGKLLEYSSRVPQIGAAVHLPVFDAGRLRAQYGGARAGIDSAVATYNDTVLTAAREVGTQVTTLAQIDAQRRERSLEVEAALRIKDVANARVQQGITDSRSELSAAETWIDRRDALLQLDAAALSADIGLQRALGGGYDNSESLASARTP